MVGAGGAGSMSTAGASAFGYCRPMPVTVALTVAIFAVGLDSYIVAAVLPAIADDLHEPIAAVGLLASAYTLPTAIFSPVFGPLSDRRGRPRPDAAAAAPRPRDQRPRRRDRAARDLRLRRRPAFAHRTRPGDGHR